jgi:hypothetical protein
VKPTELDLDAIPSATVAKERSKRKMAPWRRVAQSLRVDGPQTVAAMAKNLGYSIEWMQSLMKTWGKMGYVERVGRKYKLTDTAANLGKPIPSRTRTARPDCLVCGRKVTAHFVPHLCQGLSPVRRPRVPCVRQN